MMNSHYRTCQVPMCRSNGGMLMHWNRELVINPDSTCPFHVEPIAKCKCNEPFKIHPFPAVDSAEKRLWIDLLQRPRDFEPSCFQGVCSMHFLDGGLNQFHKITFPIRNLGLERWQFEEILKSYFNVDEHWKFLKFIDLACAEPSHELWSGHRQPGRHSGQTSGISVSSSVDRNRSRISSASLTPGNVGIKVITSAANMRSNANFPTSAASRDNSRSVMTNNVREPISGIHVTAAPSTCVAPLITVRLRNDATTSGDICHQQGHVKGGHTTNHPVSQNTRDGADQNQMDTQPGSSGQCADPAQGACQNARCNGLTARMASYRSRIDRLNTTAEALSREHRSIGVRIREAHSILNAPEQVSNQMCGKCQQVNEMYQRSWMTAKQLEIRLQQRSNERDSIKRHLFQTYGATRARVMIATLMADADACSSPSGSPTPKLDPVSPGAAAGHADTAARDK